MSVITHYQNYPIYDLIYETRFGAQLQKFTQLSLNTITKILPTGKVIDIGCGTGRLSIPLMEKHYQVVGIDLNEGMLSILKEKADKKNLIIPTFTDISKIENQGCDLALSVFTVLSYEVEEEGLKCLFKEINRHLKLGASFLFDLAVPAAFNQTNSPCKGNGLDGVVNVQFTVPGGPIANYSEVVVVNRPEFPPNHLVNEFFQIRCWTLEEINRLLKTSGFGQITYVPGFEHWGANYYVCKKEKE
jgi:SAM-dependent methyltransferase